MSSPSSGSAARAALRVLDAVPPAGGAAVMATGIVSIGLALDGYETLSRVLLGIDLALWLGLCVVFARRVVRQHPRWVEESRTPAGLTAVAGTEVLGTRLVLLGADWAGAVLLVLGLCLWLVLASSVLGHWKTPTVGVSFVLAVSTESLAVLGGLLALERGLGWLADAAFVLLVLGLIAYVFVLSRFDFRQLLAGRGDHWVIGGALAIATLACARVTAAAETSSLLDGLRGGLEEASLALWCAAMLWLPVLLVAEVVSPRLSYDTRRWSTVFPVGMYAACSFVVGDVTGIGGLTSFARVWVWVGFAVWAIVFVAMTRRGATVARGRTPRGVRPATACAERRS